MNMLLYHHLVPRSVDEIASTLALQNSLPVCAGHNESSNGYSEAGRADDQYGWYRYDIRFKTHIIGWKWIYSYFKILNILFSSHHNKPSAKYLRTVAMS
jgi:hypothetical protein